MANVKISELPAVTSVLNTDIFPVVASSVTSKLNLRNLANSLPQVTSSLSSVSSSYALTASYVQGASTADTFPYTGSAIISGSFGVTGSVNLGNSISTIHNITGSTRITGSVISSGSITTSQNTFADNYTYARTFQPYNGGYGKIPLTPVNPSVTASAAISWWPSSQNAGFATFGPGAIDLVYYSDQNLGQVGLINQSTFQNWAGSIKFINNNATMDINAGKVPYHVLITDNATLTDNNATIFTLEENNRRHVLGVTGSFLARDGVSLGTNITNLHYVTGSTRVTGSLVVTGSLSVSGSSASTSVSFTGGHVVLTQVSASLNYADDTAAAAGGVPLGGLYRNGSVVQIRVV